MRFHPSSIAIAVWNLVAVANRTVTVSGTVTVGTNNDKTGYSLTAGSYVVRASSSQRALFTLTDGSSSTTISISSVTTTRAMLRFLGNVFNGGGVDIVNELAQSFARITLTNSTTITATRGGGSTGTDSLLSYDLSELL